MLYLPVAIAILSGLSSTCASCDLENELTMNVVEEIRCNGYPAEEYEVETADGYILEVQRIPHGKSNSVISYPVLLIPGVGCDSGSYVDKLDNSLAYHLADAGFDVWLGNVRGNKHALRHSTLSMRDPKFWNYSMDEIANVDLPAMLSFILNTTKKDEVFYAGTSLGSIVGVMFLSAQPQWNSKVKGFLNILPVSRVLYMTWPMRPLIEVANYFTHVVGIPDFITTIRTKYKDSLKERKMGSPPHVLDMYEYQGYDPNTSYPFPRERLVIGHCRSGISLKAFLHFSQIMSKELHQYSYGYLGNWFHYHSLVPPAYNLSKVTTPVALFTGENDPVADPLDVALLIRSLPNVHSHYVHPYVMFSHHGMTRTNETMRTFVHAIAQVASEMAGRVNEV